MTDLQQNYSMAEGNTVNTLALRSCDLRSAARR